MTLIAEPGTFFPDMATPSLEGRAYDGARRLAVRSRLRCRLLLQLLPTEPVHVALGEPHRARERHNRPRLDQAIAMTIRADFGARRRSRCNLDKS